MNDGTATPPILDTQRLPGRLCVDHAATLLGFQSHDIPILVQKKLLRPLGRPVSNATKYFAASDIVDKANDTKWLTQASNAVYSHWQGKNAQKQSLSGKTVFQPDARVSRIAETE